MPNQPTALIAGGGGFLGRHLTRRLQQENWDIHHLTLAGRVRPTDLPGVTLHTAADASVDGVRNAIGAHRFDHVFILSAAGVSPGERALDSLFAVNVAWPATIVTALRDCAAHFLHAGSWMEYAAVPAHVAWTEDHPLGGVEIYGASKAAGGLWLAGVARQLGVKLARFACSNSMARAKRPTASPPCCCANCASIRKCLFRPAGKPATSCT